MNRFEKRYDAKVSEIERLKSDASAQRKKMFAAGGGKGNYEAAAVGTNLIGKLGLGGLGKGNVSGFQPSGGSGFKSGGGFKPDTVFKAGGGQRFLTDNSSYRGDPNESFQSMGGADALDSSLM